ELVEMRFDRDRPLRLAMLANGLDRLVDAERNADHDVGTCAPAPTGRVEELVDLGDRVRRRRIERELHPLPLTDAKQAVEQQGSGRAENDGRAHDRLERMRYVRGEAGDELRRDAARDAETDHNGAA